MGVVIGFRTEGISPDEVLRYFFQQINDSYGLEIQLSDKVLVPHLAALRSLARVYIETAKPKVSGASEQVENSLVEEIDKVRARFLGETILGILADEGLVRIAPGNPENGEDG